MQPTAASCIIFVYTRRESSDCFDVGLIIMRIRIRASVFGQIAKINIIGTKSKQASCAEMVLGSFVIFARVIQQLGFAAAMSGASPSALRSALHSSIQAYAQML